MLQLLVFCVPLACRDHKPDERASDPLELELQLTVSSYVGVWVSNLGPLQEQPMSVLNHCAISIAPV